MNDLETRVAVLETVITERDALFRSMLEATAHRFSASSIATSEALSKAEAATDKRFEAVNAFRAALNDQSAKNLTRVEADARFQALGDKLEVMQARLDKAEGSNAGMRNGWGLLIGAIALVATVLTIYGSIARSPSDARIGDIVSRMDAMSSRLNSVTPTIAPK